MKLISNTPAFRAGFLLVSVALLSACGSDEAESTAAPAAAPVQESTTQSVLAGGEIIEQAQEQLDQFTADAESRLDDAMSDAAEMANDVEEEAKQKAEDLEDNVRGQLQSFGN